MKKLLFWVLVVGIVVLTLKGALADTIFYQGNSTTILYATPLYLGYNLTSANATDGLIWVNLSVAGGSGCGGGTGCPLFQIDSNNDATYYQGWTLKREDSRLKYFISTTVYDFPNYVGAPTWGSNTYANVTLALSTDNNNGSAWVMVNGGSLYYMGNFTVTDAATKFIGTIWDGNGDAPSNLTNVVIYAKEAAPMATVSWVSPVPADGAHNSTQVTINATCSSGNVYLWFDNQSTPTTLVIDNQSTAEYTTTVASDGAYYYVASCEENLGTNTSTRTWYYDTTSPNLFLNPSNGFNVLNQSMVNQYNNSLQLNMTLTDNIALYAYQLNVTNASGGNVYTVQNTSISGLTYLWEQVLATTSWPWGTYKFAFAVADSHTAQSIPDYEVEQGLNYITFTTPDGNVITIESETDVTEHVVKEDDRYSFSFDFVDAEPQTRIFMVKSLNKNGLRYLPDSPYPGHIVAFSGPGGNWVDFAGVDQEPVVTVLNDKTIRVRFNNLGGSADFHSIGGLNVELVNYTWYRGNYSFINPFGLTGDNTTLGLNVSFDASTQRNITASLYYNGSLVPNSVQSVDGDWIVLRSTFTNVDNATNLTYYWEVMVEQLDGNVSRFNTSVATHAVYDFGVLPCGGDASVLTATLFYFNESQPLQSLEASLNIEVESFATAGNTRTYAANLSLNQSHSLCIIPGTGTLQANIYAQYTTLEGFTHRYILRNHTFSNVSQNLSLYNFNGTGGISDLKITLRNNSNYNTYPDVIGKLQRRYVGEGVWRTVQYDQSGDLGVLFYNIIEENTDYKLVFTDLDNNVLRTTAPMKFICNSGLCDVTFTLSPYSITSSTTNISYSLVYQNESSLLNYTWLDPEGDTRTVVFNVSKSTVTGFQTICDTTQVGSGGNYVCNVSGYSGAVLVNTWLDGVLYTGEYVELERTTLGKLAGSREGALWALLILVAIVAAGLFSPVGTVLGAFVGLVIIYFLGILNPLTLTGLIIAGAVSLVISLKLRQ